MIKNLAIGGSSNRLLLIFALVLGLVCAVLVGVYLSGLEDKGGTTQSSSTVPVVVAASDIPAATVITPEMLVVKAVPADLALIGAFRQTSEAVGQTTQVQILAGEQMVPNKVASAGTATVQYGPNPPLSVIVPEGSRAFSIALSAVAAAGGLVRPGDHVDVMMTTSAGTGDQGQSLPSSTCYVVQNIEVLAIGSALTQATSETDANGIAASSPDEGASTMTLAVTPVQAGFLASAQGGLSGSSVSSPLWVVLRNFSDHNVASDVPACDLAAPSA
jgi:pilus assembly protein CpaB